MRHPTEKIVNRTFLVSKLAENVVAGLPQRPGLPRLTLTLSKVHQLTPCQGPGQQWILCLQRMIESQFSVSLNPRGHSMVGSRMPHPLHFRVWVEPIGSLPGVHYKCQNRTDRALSGVQQPLTGWMTIDTTPEQPLLCSVSSRPVPAMTGAAVGHGLPRRARTASFI